MAINISIQFSALIFDETNKPVNNYSVNVQYFNMATLQWMLLGKPSICKKGKVFFKYNIPDKIPRTDITTTKLKAIIASGSLPMFRLTQTNNRSKINYVLSSNTIVEDSNNKKILHLNFGNLTLLNKKYWIQLKKETSILIASNIDVKTLQGSKEISVPKTSTSVLEKKVLASNKKTVALEKTLESIKKEKLLTAKSLSLKTSEVTKNLKQITALQKESTKLKNDFSVVNASLKTVTNTNKSLQKTINSNTTLIKSLKKDALAKANKNLLLEKKITTLEKDKIDLKALLDKTKVERKNFTPKAISANAIYTNIINDVKLADTKTIGSGYQLGAFKINLKTVVEHDDDGMRFQPIDIKNAAGINGSAISDLQIDIIKNPTTISKNKLTPNVIGLTETAVRKILLDFGLKLDPIYQSIDQKTNKLTIGQSFKQQPNAGDEFGISKTVTVIFAKNNIN